MPKAPEVSSDDGEVSFRAISWNIQWFPGRVPDAPQEAQKTHVEESTAKLTELDPDVLFLQEIRDWKSAQSLVSAVPGMQLHVVSNFPEREQNLVIASKYPADAAWVEAWKAAEPEAPPRGFAFAALRLPGNRIVLAYSVHFKSNHGDQSVNFGLRQESARQLLQHVEKMLTLYSRHATCSVLVGGDFNTSLDDSRFDREKTLESIKASGLQWVYANMPFKERVTIPGNGPFPPGCFDHFFTLGLRAASVEVSHLPELSDHNPVIVRFELDPAGVTPLNLKNLETLRTVVPPPPPAVLTEGQVVDAADKDLLARLEDQEVSVRGVVTRVGRSPSGHLIFINFSRDRGGFTVLVRREFHASFAAELGGEPEEVLTGKELELRGVISMYGGTPQMEISGKEHIVHGL